MSTFEHRCLLFIKLAIHSRMKAVWKPSSPGWALLYLETPAGQISYHFPEKFLPIVEANFERDDSYKYDGHTSADVLKRLMENWKGKGGVKSSIFLPTTEMQIRFRVMAWNGEQWTLLFTSEIYQSAEDFCWSYQGRLELTIRKVWVPK